MKRLLLPIGTLAALALGWSQFHQNATDDKPNDNTNWGEYLGGPDRSHYSALTQIAPANVAQLKVAWTYTSPDSGQIQTNPIVVDGVLYGVTPTVQAFALDAATGKEIWKFGDPLKVWHSTSRGVTYWVSGSDKRILYTVGPKLYALDATTGKPIPDFGTNGTADLHDGLGGQAKDKFIISNTPGTLFEDLIVMPVRVSEGPDAAPGYIRAFNVRTGKLVWTFRTIPNPGELGYETWPKEAHKNTDVGAANNWAGMAVDRPRGIIYVPTGSAAYDFYGGNRKGQNLFANCLLALDARTGKRLWHFQAVHHDIWDRDFPAPPNLITVTHNGKKIDAVAQITKSGHVYTFDRVTGKPLFPIREVPVPKSDIPGESSWPTQPVPQKPAAFARQAMTEADINPYSTDRDSLLATFRKIGKRFYEPISKRGSLLFPGCDGGGEWGGAAADPDGILYVNANDIPWIFTMVDAPKDDELAHLSPGQRLYTQNCISCHGPERKGNARSGYPSLANISQRRDRPYVSQIISNGKGMMPGFTALSAEQKQALIAFLFNDEKQEVASSSPYPSKTKEPYLPYKVTGYNKFQDSKGLSAVAPPWGTLNAIDLNTGEYLWKIPLGEDPEMAAKGIRHTGTENYGGPVVTASGLLFIAATKDEKFRAFDKKTGKLLWETTLPAAGFATPATYQVGGKQYVVIACGGVKLGTKKGNQYVAFALP
ncbi:outer membrane protein assembly factor BamB family protein [Spirosoma utsteinense]|uniref:outer membrane protein assembly factor BamB family protein n=1 Tax=Spirosoma utsteinense TaxID=2585773 RepID=UPI001645F8F5|nr:PQQ-binding-like beta-propeller repeat protein [Spirosoma utsteinense]MBC3787207.1 quinoprotein glucose dehydrogenase [Spirosoma utsteinense]